LTFDRPREYDLGGESPMVRELSRHGGSRALPDYAEPAGRVIAQEGS